ncbi:MAG: hypothetical protein J5I93_15505 [Pirellulaceae bacterium]|nr:hypothetical protein [Pirellulaceae bacterium]
MNRIQLPPLASPAGGPEFVQQARITRGELQGVPHATFVPMHYEPNYAYPLLIWLHGPGDDERQLPRLMPHISMRNFVAIAPRCAAPPTAASSAAEAEWEADGVLPRVEQAVFDCLQMASERYHIAAHRVFLAGFGPAGTLAFRIGLRQPKWFAGLASLQGPFPAGNVPLVHLDQVRRLPLFIAQGRESAAYPVERTCDELRLFHAAGMNVTLRQYPCAEQLADLMLRDLNGWIMEQVTGQSASSHAEVISSPGDGDSP